LCGEILHSGQGASFNNFDKSSTQACREKNCDQNLIAKFAIFVTRIFFKKTVQYKSVHEENELISLPSRFGFEGTINWFPGHMAKATKRISQTLNLVTTIIELRDARIPVSSSNPILKDVIGTKRRIVVLNKSDLCNLNITNIHVKKLRNEAGISGVQLMDA